MPHSLHREPGARWYGDAPELYPKSRFVHKRRNGYLPRRRILEALKAGASFYNLAAAAEVPADYIAGCADDPAFAKKMLNAMAGAVQERWQGLSPSDQIGLLDALERGGIAIAYSADVARLKDVIDRNG